MRLKRARAATNGCLKCFLFICRPRSTSQQQHLTGLELWVPFLRLTHSICVCNLEMGWPAYLLNLIFAYLPTHFYAFLLTPPSLPAFLPLPPSFLPRPFFILPIFYPVHLPTYLSPNLIIYFYPLPFHQAL